MFVCFVFFCYRARIQEALGQNKWLIIYDPEVRAEHMSFPKTGSFNRTHGVIPQKTCAVVGCSGILLNSSCGKEIDAHDFVIRTNLPGLRGFELDVGKKQNLTTINAEGARALSKLITKMNDTSSTKVGAIQRLKDLNGSILFETKGGVTLSRVFKRIITASQSMSINFQAAYTLVGTATQK